MRNAAAITFLGLILLGSCKKPADRSCWKAHGENSLEVRDLALFNSIEVNDHIFVEITFDTFQSVRVEAGENVLGFIATKVENGNLVLLDGNKCAWLRNYDQQITVHITTDRLDSLVNNSTANITSTNTIVVPTFRYASYQGSGTVSLDLDVSSARIIAQTGPVDITLIGRTNNLYVYHSGNGNIDTKWLMSRNTQVNHAGTGEFHVHAVNTISAEIFSKGNVYYSGDPFSVIVNATDDGQLIHE
jgi:hypothetical protein